ncbi:hypothetical protein ACNKHU_13790 [Shigella flexneri]
MIACGDGALEIVTGQAGDGITVQGWISADAGPGARFTPIASLPATARRRTRVLILG